MKIQENMYACIRVSNKHNTYKIEVSPYLYALKYPKLPLNPRFLDFHANLKCAHIYTQDVSIPITLKARLPLAIATSHKNLFSTILPTSPIYQEEKRKIPLEIIFLSKHDFHISPPFDINLKDGCTAPARTIEKKSHTHSM